MGLFHAALEDGGTSGPGAAVSDPTRPIGRSNAYTPFTQVWEPSCRMVKTPLDRHSPTKRKELLECRP